jgi:uracil-DNA glycosylase
MTEQIDDFEDLWERIATCSRCERLVVERESVALNKPEPYWARGVPGFGKKDAQILIVGLNPGPSGANRTGRPFTGDPAGDLLFVGLHRVDLANQPTSVGKGDGLELNNCYITNIVKCAQAKTDDPLKAQEKENCRSFLLYEIRFLEQLKVIVAVGRDAFDEICRAHHQKPPPPVAKQLRPPVTLPSRGIKLIETWHTSARNQRNQTIDEKGLVAVLRQAIDLCNR